MSMLKQVARLCSIFQPYTNQHVECRHLFNADEYRDRCQIARGAFSEVYTCSCCKQGKAAPQLALKVSDLPSESRQNERAQVS